MYIKRRDWTLYFLGTLVAACIAVILFFAAKPAAADVVITIMGTTPPDEILPGGGVMIDASPPFPEPILFAYTHPAITGGEALVVQTTGTQYQFLPTTEAVGPYPVVVSGDRVLDQLAFPAFRTTVRVSGDGLTYAAFSAAPVWSGPHPGDFNRDAAVDTEDIFDFFAAWFDSSPAADLNGSAACDVGDIFDFLRVWNQ